jgi:polyisoprenoid-binding protein YceI
MLSLKNYLFAAAIAATSLFVSCNHTAQADDAPVSDKKEVANVSGNQFIIDTSDSHVRFIGYGVGKSHPGSLKLSNGNILVENNELRGGNFTINIKSLGVDEEGDMFQEKLKGHLLSADFLDAEKHSTSTFRITDVRPFTTAGSDTSVVAGANYTVSGNFTLKETTKNISFPAKVEILDGQLTAIANFNIDRADWSMHYGTDKSLGDKFISEKVNIQLNLVARP